MAQALLRNARGSRPVRGLFREPVFRRLADAMASAVEAELDEAGGVRCERGYYFYLMNNDQRRHLHHHFENIDRYRTEFMIPFYDAEFVKGMVSVPMEPCLHHGFYYDWMKRFPAPVSQIPWQAYPGHLPCPVDSGGGPAGARSQWERTASERWRASRPVFREALRIFLRSPFSGFPGELMRRGSCAAALLAHGLRLRHCEGILKTYLAFQAGYDENDGRVELPEARA